VPISLPPSCSAVTIERSCLHAPAEKLPMGPYSSRSAATWVWCPFCRVAGLQQQEEQIETDDDEEGEEQEEVGLLSPNTLARRAQLARALKQKSKAYLRSPASVTRLLA
jgi:hypothetical protein